MYHLSRSKGETSLAELGRWLGLLDLPEVDHEAMVQSDPASLRQYLEATGLAFKRIGMEACPLSQ